MLWRAFNGVCMAGLVLLAPKPLQSQQVASYDYSEAKVAERLRPPLPPPPVKPSYTRAPSHPPPPPKPVPEEVGRGVCGGVLGNPPLVLSIVSLDRDSYVFGDEFHFTLQLKAVVPARVPVRISIGEIEPSDPAQSYRWRPMLISMDLLGPDNREARIKLLQLYGSPDSPGSEVELRVGEWIEVHGKARMEWNNPPPSHSLPRGVADRSIRVPLGGAEMFQATVMEQRQGSFMYDASTRLENQLCDYPAEASSRAVPTNITVSPK